MFSDKMFTSLPQRRPPFLHTHIYIYVYACVCLPNKHWSIFDAISYREHLLLPNFIKMLVFTSPMTAVISENFFFNFAKIRLFSLYFLPLKCKKINNILSKHFFFLYIFHERENATVNINRLRHFKENLLGKNGHFEIILYI